MAWKEVGGFEGQREFGFWGSGQCGNQLLHSDKVDYSFQVVTQNCQAHLGAHLIQSSH